MDELTSKNLGFGPKREHGHIDLWKIGERWRIYAIVLKKKKMKKFIVWTELYAPCVFNIYFVQEYASQSSCEQIIRKGVLLCNI